METIFNHKSIRKYLSNKIEPQKVDRMVEAATRASTIGNMQLYSIILTTDDKIKGELSPCHFNQPMVCHAPLVVTFCADINRFTLWAKHSGAEPEYDNFLWYINGAIDALLASQNFALEAESLDLGVCYLGTTLYTADKIIEVLNLPCGVVPITTLVVGYPDEQPSLTDRLPERAVVHYDKYQNYTPEQLDSYWAQKEASEQTAKLLKDNGASSLAEVFTNHRYKKEDNILFSQRYYDVLVKQGFLKR